MEHNTAKKTWGDYCETERARLTPILMRHGCTLDDAQPHLQGERYLMQAVTTASGRKLILLGTHADGYRVVIKATADSSGKKELLHERACKRVLQQINFAGEIFYLPKEIGFIEERGYIISIQQFIEQTSPFLERPIKEQFALALCAFKGQESAHAATSRHIRLIGSTFGVRDADAYLRSFGEFRANIKNVLPDRNNLHELFKTAEVELEGNHKNIEQYSGFLTHTDFVPHNIRVADGKIYLLDHSSLTFGNKYEGWARFLNFMQLYNQELMDALTQYVEDNRTEEESVSLRLMRIYRLGEITWYYVDKLKRSDGNLLKLNETRVSLWSDILSYVLENKRVPESLINTYTDRRDELRSEDEKIRQRNLH